MLPGVLVGNKRWHQSTLPLFLLQSFSLPQVAMTISSAVVTIILLIHYWSADNKLILRKMHTTVAAVLTGA